MNRCSSFLLLALLTILPLSLHAMGDPEEEHYSIHESYNGLSSSPTAPRSILCKKREKRRSLSSREPNQGLSSIPTAPSSILRKKQEKRRSLSSREPNHSLSSSPTQRLERRDSFSSQESGTSISFSPSRKQEKGDSSSGSENSNGFSTNLDSTHRGRSVEPFERDIKNKKRGQSKSSHVSSELFVIPSSLEKIEEPKRGYLIAATYLIKNCKSYSNTANILVSSYPVFVDEKHLFVFLNELTKTDAEQIHGFLEKLVLAAFPNGIDNLTLAQEEFNALKKGFYIPLLNLPILSKCSLEPVELINPDAANRINKIDSKRFDIGKFVKALKDRDTRFFRNIKLTEIKAYLENQKNPPKIIETLGKHFDRTTDWIIWQIVSQKEQEERDRLIHNFLFTGRVLLESHNFHGTMQVAMALMNPAVKRLIPEKELMDPNWTSLSNFADPTGNYIRYRKLLSKFQDQDNCLPVFSILFSDVLHGYDTFNSAYSAPPHQMNFPTMANGLQEISQALTTLTRCRTLPCLPLVPDDYTFVWEFNEIQEEILDAFSSLRKEWAILEGPDVPQALVDWNSSYFASLLRKNGCDDQIEAIFDLGVYDGKSIISYMGEPPQTAQRERLMELNMNESMINSIISANNSSRSIKKARGILGL